MKFFSIIFALVVLFNIVSCLRVVPKANIDNTLRIGQNEAKKQTFLQKIESKSEKMTKVEKLEKVESGKAKAKTRTEAKSQAELEMEKIKKENDDYEMLRANAMAEMIF